MPLQDLLQSLGDGIQDPEEETFLLFSQSIPSQNLGFIDAKARDLDLTIASRDLSITQSPGLLSSDRKGGTTGAVVWKITPLFAEWMTSSDNVLFRTSILGQTSQVLELGCGISGILAIALAPKICRYFATDQDYVFKLLKSNIEGNTSKQKEFRKAKHPAHMFTKSNIDVIALDWESDSIANLSMLTGRPSADELSQTLNAVIACDCIYNEALIAPFVRTCVESCDLEQVARSKKPTVCIVAQQLRSESVFEAWLAAFHRVFRVWRVPDEMLTEHLRQGSGFVIHIGILRREDG